MFVCANVVVVVVDVCVFSCMYLCVYLCLCVVSLFVCVSVASSKTIRTNEPDFPSNIKNI